MTLQSVPDLQHRTVLLDEAVDALAIEGARAGSPADAAYLIAGYNRTMAIQRRDFLYKKRFQN